MTNCKNPECRSDDAHRRRYCRGLCRNCYMRQWRSERTQEIERRESRIDDMQASLQGYTKRNLPVLRRRTVQRLLDLGMNDEEVIIEFSQREDLQKLLMSCKGDPVKALQRDLSDFAAKNRGKSDSQRTLERQIRQLLDQLKDDNLSARDRARLYEHLHRLEAV